MADIHLGAEDTWHPLERRFHVMPILAVVLKQGSDNDVMVLSITFPFILHRIQLVSLLLLLRR